MKSTIFHQADSTLNAFNLSHMDFLDDPAAIHGSSLIISCTTKDASSNEYIDPEIWSNNHLKRIYSFTLILLAITLANIISSCACIVLLSEASSSSHVEFNIARQRRPLASETSMLPYLTASNHEIHHFHHLTRPWSILIFLIWIFWMTPLQSTEADW